MEPATITEEQTPTTDHTCVALHATVAADQVEPNVLDSQEAPPSVTEGSEEISATSTHLLQSTPQRDTYAPVTSLDHFPIEVDSEGDAVSPEVVDVESGGASECESVDPTSDSCELARLTNIRRNAEVLKSLGLAKSNIAVFAVSDMKSKKQKRAKVKTLPTCLPEDFERRRSSRKKGEQVDSGVAIEGTKQSTIEVSSPTPEVFDDSTIFKYIGSKYQVR